MTTHLTAPADHAPTTNPHVLPATTHSYLARAAESLSEAVAATEVTTRYACAHVAALRAAAALLAARARPAVPTRRKPQKNAWVLLAEVAPELAEWAASSPPAPASGPRPRPAPAGRSPSARPTTWSATPTGSWPWSSSRSGWPRTRRRCPSCPSPPCTPYAAWADEHHETMSDPFVHLHVASGYSLRYGASHPHTLVERAAEQEMDTLALTDRDGTYGAVKFARACYAAGIRPVLGVELAHHPTQRVVHAATARPGRRCAAAATATRPGVAGRAAAGDVPGQRRRLRRKGERRPGRLGGAVPAGLGDPPGGGARRPGPRPRRPRRRRLGGDLGQQVPSMSRPAT